MFLLIILYFFYLLFSLNSLTPNVRLSSHVPHCGDNAFLLFWFKGLFGKFPDLIVLGLKPAGWPKPAIPSYDDSMGVSENKACIIAICMQLSNGQRNSHAIRKKIQFIACRIVNRENL